MSEENNFLAPLEFFNSPVLLSASRPELFPKGTEITRDLATAMSLENDQGLPAPYRNWSDALANAVSPFYTTADGRKGRGIIDAKADEVWASKGPFELELKKKRIRKTISEREEFWLTVAYDILEVLKSIALARYVGGTSESSFLENVFAVFLAGFYPCGVKDDGSLVAFDPLVLKE